MSENLSVRETLEKIGELVRDERPLVYPEKNHLRRLVAAGLKELETVGERIMVRGGEHDGRLGTIRHTGLYAGHDLRYYVVELDGDCQLVACHNGEYDWETTDGDDPKSDA